MVKFFLRVSRGVCNALCMTTQRSDLLVPQFDLADRMRKALRVEYAERDSRKKVTVRNEQDTSSLSLEEAA
jgi:hypothetical protein